MTRRFNNTRPILLNLKIKVHTWIPFFLKSLFTSLELIRPYILFVISLVWIIVNLSRWCVRAVTLMLIVSKCVTADYNCTFSVYFPAQYNSVYITGNFSTVSIRCDVTKCKRITRIILIYHTKMRHVYN